MFGNFSSLLCWGFVAQCMCVAIFAREKQTRRLSTWPHFLLFKARLSWAENVLRMYGVHCSYLFRILHILFGRVKLTIQANTFCCKLQKITLAIKTNAICTLFKLSRKCPGNVWRPLLLVAEYLWPPCCHLYKQKQKTSSLNVFCNIYLYVEREQKRTKNAKKDHQEPKRYWDEWEEKNGMCLVQVIKTYRAPDGAKKIHLNILQHFLLDFRSGGCSLGPLTRVQK